MHSPNGERNGCKMVSPLFPSVNTHTSCLPLFMVTSLSSFVPFSLTTAQSADSGPVTEANLLEHYPQLQPYEATLPAVAACLRGVGVATMAELKRQGSALLEDPGLMFVADQLRCMFELEPDGKPPSSPSTSQEHV